MAVCYTGSLKGREQVANTWLLSGFKNQFNSFEIFYI
jgi:hypothetical protein